MEIITMMMIMVVGGKLRRKKNSHFLNVQQVVVVVYLVFLDWMNEWILGKSHNKHDNSFGKQHIY